LRIDLRQLSIIYKMNQSTIKIAVKNMVCNRCIKVIKEELLLNNIDFVKVDLGVIELVTAVSDDEKEKLITLLKKEGFELVEDREATIVNKIKSLIIENIHYQKVKQESQNFSDFLVDHLKVEYPYLSKLFSEIESKTIEHFTIEQKIERAKELLTYNQLTLSQISYDLNYSSPQHLSRQFKKVTGFTPTQFKIDGVRKKLDTI